MKILFVRHGETTDNVKRVYAGVTDSQLTTHGVLQAEKLAVYVREHLPVITHAFASPLSRARMTCQAIVDGQKKDTAREKKVEVVVVKELEEQDFGSYEGEPFLSTVPLRERRKFKSVPVAGTKRKKEVEDEEDTVMTAGDSGPLTGKEDKAIPGEPVEETVAEKKAEGKKVSEKEEEEELEEFREMESIQHISARADRFVREHIVPLLPAKLPEEKKDNTNNVIVIVSHGIFLSHLWKAFISLFPPSSVLATTPVVERGWYQGKNPGWGNTGYLHVSVFSSTGGPVVPGSMTVVIEGVNEKEHLKTLKKTGGGVGNEKFDERQQKMDSFLTKKVENGDAKVAEEKKDEAGAEDKVGAEIKKTRTK